MVNANVGSLLVIERGKLRGIVTERDYLRRVALRAARSVRTRVRDVGRRSSTSRPRPASSSAWR